MTAATIAITIPILKIARAWGDCGLSAFTTSTPNNAVLGSCRFTRTPIVPSASNECENIYCNAWMTHYREADSADHNEFMMKMSRASIFRVFASALDSSAHHQR